MGRLLRSKEREKRLVSGIPAFLLLSALLVQLVPSDVEGITTTDSLVESTHTPLPVTLGAVEADLREAETKDPQRLEIIKQIRNVNQDGSYTVGYEAEDGTFKIESRDVLGNIKGTYGYIDVNGEIKRVSYGGSGQPSQSPLSLGTTAAPPSSTTEEDVVHIPPRFNRSQQQPQHQHQQLLVPTTRRPLNYQPPQHQPPHHNPQHASTLRPSVIQTIPRKRTGGYHGSSTITSTTTSTTTTTSATTAARMSSSSGTSMSTTTTSSPASTNALLERQHGVTVSMTTPRPTMETGGSLAGAFGEPTTAASSHSKPQSTVLIIRPTPLPYQTTRTAEQLARPERLEGGNGKYGQLTSSPSKKPVRGNFLRRQLAPPAAAAVAATESGEQYEAQQQQIVYGQSDGELGSIYTTGGVKPLYTTHPAPRIPAAVLAARQRAAQIQSVLQAQGGSPTRPDGERLGKERVYVKQPARPGPVLYESSTEPSLEHGYVTDGPGAPSVVVQIPAGNRAATVAASESDVDIDERRPVFRPRPIDFRPRESLPPAGRYRTPYGLPQPFGRSSFTPLPPPQELPYASRVSAAENSVDDSDPDDAQQQYQNHQINTIPYRQQRRLSGGEPAGYAGHQQHQPQHQPPPQQQQQQNSPYPVPVPFGPAQYPGRNPYYYDIPPERPLTARDFERILQLLIFRHQQLQQQRYRGGGGGYYGGYNGGFPYNNPYFPGPSPSPFGLSGPGGFAGGGYPQQQIPRPPLPYPYGSPYDAGLGYQNPLYSPSAPSSAMHPGPDGGPSDADGDYGRPAAGRRSGQYFRPPTLDAGSAASGGGSGRPGDYLPPEVRESLLYRMLMLAIQTSGSSSEVLPLAAPTGSQLPGLLGHHPLQGASSVPRSQTQPTLQQRMPVAHQQHQDGSVTAASSAATPLPMYSKKPVRSVQILGEE